MSSCQSLRMLYILTIDYRQILTRVINIKNYKIDELHAKIS